MQEDPLIVGIVNITADSFSDGGLYLEPQGAVDHARSLIADGASVIELGPASSHPNAARVGPEEEQRRLWPVLEPLKGAGVALSVDSFEPYTQMSVASEVQFLNDIYGFPYPEVRAELAASSCRFVVVHSVHGPRPVTADVGDSTDIVERACRFFDKRLEDFEAVSVDRSRLVIDPGLGFLVGGNPEASLEILRHIGLFRTRYELPIFLSASRKSFLRVLTGSPLKDVLPATLAAEMYMALQGVAFIRTHDVRALRDALVMLDAIG